MVTGRARSMACEPLIDFTSLLSYAFSSWAALSLAALSPTRLFCSGRSSLGVRRKPGQMFMAKKRRAMKIELAAKMFTVFYTPISV